jgi:hypothetical protein
VDLVLYFGDKFCVELGFYVFGEVVCLCFRVEKFEGEFGIVIQIFVDSSFCLEYLGQNVFFESKDHIEFFGHHLN